MKKLSRRDFLKLGGLTVSSLALSGMAFNSFLPETTGFDDVNLVRVATDSVSVYAQPDDASAIVRTWERDSLVHVYETVNSGTPGYNPIWYRVFGGYMHRARLQEVRVHYNTPLDSIPETKLLAEITVPFSTAYQYNKWNGWFPTFRMYYSSIQWLKGIDTGPDGKAWYLVLDEADETIHYVPAEHLHPFPTSLLDPISPDVPADKKSIDVNLSSQILTCYEDGLPVFTTDVATGVPYTYTTPSGNFNILVKLPSRRMATTDRFGEGIPLTGIPWCCFFTSEGHAFHGTYWHQNFGVPMSRGCVNMRNEEALWLFRWSTPASAFADIDPLTLDVKGRGTSLNIHS